MLFTPYRVCGLGAFVEFLVTAEDEPDVDVRTLCFDQKVLLPVTGNKATFSFDIKIPTIAGEYLEVWCVLR